MEKCLPIEGSALIEAGQGSVGLEQFAAPHWQATEGSEWPDNLS
jgi:hypothetical protein